MKNKSKNRRGQNGSDFPRPPPTAQLTYRGQIPTRTSERGITVILRQVSAQTTAVAGTTLNLLLGNNPSSSDNWADYAAAWTQYRVLGIRFEWQPYQNTSSTGVTPLNYGSHVHTILHQTAAPSTNTVANCFSSGDSKVTQFYKPYVRVWKMLDQNEASWIATSAPASTSYTFSSYANNLTINSTYGVMFVTYFVQFRTSNT